MSRVNWKTQFDFIEANSKFHNKVRDILRRDVPFRFMNCFQEIPVHELCPGYHSRAHRYDWFIEDTGHVIELHGEQHYKFTNRGNIGYEEAHRAFKKGQARDRQKKIAAIEAGFEYVEISYKFANKLDAKLLKQLIFG
jgi:hypothetical protein